jgi:hypothetical protein
MLFDTCQFTDVNYKLSRKGWRRDDLFQITTFASGFRTNVRAVIDFMPPGAVALSSPSLSGVGITHVPWPANLDLTPKRAAAAFIAEALQWIRSYGSWRNERKGPAGASFRDLSWAQSFRVVGALLLCVLARPQPIKFQSY